MNRRTFLESTTLAGLAGTTVPVTHAAEPGGGPANGPDVVLDPVHAPQEALPAGSCDCHVHVFDPARFPYVPQRSYTPGVATVAELLAFEARLGIERVVLVQPSGYGSDNRCLMQALAELGPQRARGVAVVDVWQVSASEIEALHQGGVRSIRLNLEVKGEQGPETARRLLQQALQVAAHRQWSVQMYADLGLVESLEETLAGSRLPVVLDHFAGLKAARGLAQPGWSALLRLLREAPLAPLWVKLSAPYRASALPDWADLKPYVQALLAAAPGRLVWASDWPHTGSAGQRSGDLARVEPFRRIDGGQVLDQLAGWVGDAGLWQRVLVDNPARLYGWA